MNTSDTYRSNLVIKILDNFFKDMQEAFNLLKGEEKLDALNSFILIAQKCQKGITEVNYHHEITDIYNILHNKYRSKLKIVDEKGIMWYFLRDYLIHRYWLYMASDEFNKLDEQILTDEEFSNLMQQIQNMLFKERSKILNNLLPCRELSKQITGKVTVTNNKENKTGLETDEKTKPWKDSEDEINNQNIDERLDKIESQLSEKSNEDTNPESEEDPFLRHLTEISKFIGCGNNKSQNLKKEFQYIFIQNGRKFLVNKWILLEEMKKKGMKMGKRFK
jgi:hypothetical protein